MKGVDTHCHLQMAPFDEDREAALDRALQVLKWLVVVGYGLDGSESALALCRPVVYATAGFHPYLASGYDDAGEARLKELAQKKGIVALGEMGLDYFNEFSPRPEQRVCFERQLALAAELQLPVIIHCREADEDTEAILKDYISDLPECIMHCFGGTASFAERCVGMGCYVSFAGNVTFPKAQTLREAALVVPLERLLAETDAPYLAPQSFRGKRCEPAHVMTTLTFLAQLKGLPPEQLIGQVVKNGEQAYRLC